jgi:hypothetical protein
VLRAAGETETTQANIRDWLQLDEGPGFQLLTEEEIAAVMFFTCLFSSTLSTLHFSSSCFLSFFLDHLLLH